MGIVDPQASPLISPPNQTLGTCAPSLEHFSVGTPPWQLGLLKPWQPVLLLGHHAPPSELISKAALETQPEYTCAWVSGVDKANQGGLTAIGLAQDNLSRILP